MLKRRYGPLVDPLPSPNTMAEHLPFETGKALGDDFQVTVKLGLEHGVTRDNTRTAFTLMGAVDSVTKPARLAGSSINIQGRIPREMLAAMSNGNEASYGEGLDTKVVGLAAGLEFHREIDLHYGCGSAAAAAANIGVISTIVSGANLAAPIVADLTRASYSAGIWNLMVGGIVDILQADATTVRAAEVTVTAVNHSFNRVTLFKTGSAVLPVATDILVPRTGRTLSCYGVQAILENTGSMFGISAATYPQWKALQFAVGGAMTRAKIMSVGARLRQNGLRRGGKMFVNANTFADLAEEGNTLFRELEAKTIRVQGAENIQYKTACGIVDVAVDDVMKQGIWMFLGNKVGRRVGSTDNTFTLPGSRKWFFQELENAAGAQLQGYMNQAPLLDIPYHCAIGTGVTNTADTSPSA